MISGPCAIIYIYLRVSFFTALSLQFFCLVDTENESATLVPKAPKEIIDLKEVKRIDHILASLQRKVMFDCTTFLYSIMNTPLCY